MTQVVEIIPGQAIVNGKRLLDTCLVRFRIENKDNKPHSVGFRFLLDTYIGANDGVPFYIPGDNVLVTDKHEFAGNKVPNFLQAQELPALDKPGTVARPDVESRQWAGTARPGAADPLGRRDIQ